MLERAKPDGFPSKHWDDFKSLIRKHTFASSSGFSSSPTKVATLQIVLTDNAKRVRVQLLNYSASQREFMATLVADLTRHGLVDASPTYQWAYAPLIVPKPGPAGCRFTIDLRPVYRYTKRHQLPVIEQELTKNPQSNFYPEFDFKHSYWQRLLHPDSQKCQLFLPLDGVFIPMRVPHY